MRIRSRIVCESSAMMSAINASIQGILSSVHANSKRVALVDDLIPGTTGTSPGSMIDFSCHIRLANPFSA